MAAAAKIVGSAKLNQQAAVATNNFPGINRGKSGSHEQVGVARAGKTHGTQRHGSDALRNVRYKACGSQVNFRLIRGSTPTKPKENQRNTGENREEKMGEQNRA
jgi:hypothetical protein